MSTKAPSKQSTPNKSLPSNHLHQVKVFHQNHLLLVQVIQVKKDKGVIGVARKIRGSDTNG